MNGSLASIWPAVANHLWQSTVFAAVVVLVTWLLRRNAARVRYGLWLTASMKFLLPFSLLVSLGGLLPKSQQITARTQTTETAVEAVAQPFPVAEDIGTKIEAAKGLPVSETAVWATEVAVTPVAPAHVATRRDRIAVWVVAVWTCGVIVVLASWLRRWRQVDVLRRRAEMATEGRELEALRRMDTQLPLLLSLERMEPGIFGIFRQVLVWPQSLSARLDEEHIEAIIAHELEHARRHDNLTAALHMLVEVIFWFHPMVWWMERRLVEERERACDEAVIAHHWSAETYAEGLLRACRFCVETPLVCVAGISGADLNRRVRSILTLRWQRLSWARRLVLASLAISVVAGPMLLGQMRASLRQVRPLQLLMASVQAHVIAEDYAVVATLPVREEHALQRATGESTTRQVTAPVAVLGAGLNIISNTQAVNFDSYMRDLHDAIKQNWSSLLPADIEPPTSVAGVTRVRFAILPDGQIGAPVLVTKSGDVELDKAAWGAIVTQGKLPPLPKEFHGPELVLEVGFFVNTDPGTAQDGGSSAAAPETELKQEYKKWLNEDARWIITDQEIAAFQHLQNDTERDAFIEAFWQRRNPNPGDPKNAYRDEHYRRIAYANEHYTAGEPGWKTDRGMILIKFGEPDNVDSHTTGGESVAANGVQTATYPFERWHYKNIDGVGAAVEIQFVDRCRCGDYAMTLEAVRTADHFYEYGRSDLEQFLALLRPATQAASSVQLPDLISWAKLQQLNPSLIPNQQPDEIRALNGKVVRVVGFMVPLQDGATRVDEFILVSHLGGNMHDAPPMANQMVYVKLGEAAPLDTRQSIVVTGELSLDNVQSPYGNVSYSMRGATVRPPRPGLPVPSCDPNDTSCSFQR